MDREWLLATFADGERPHDFTPTPHRLAGLASRVQWPPMGSKPNNPPADRSGEHSYSTDGAMSRPGLTFKIDWLLEGLIVVLFALLIVARLTYR